MYWDGCENREPGVQVIRSFQAGVDPSAKRLALVLAFIAQRCRKNDVRASKL